MGLLDILYRDDDFVAVNKPAGLVVHRSRLASDHTAALQLVRDQVGQYVYPAHRLDRPTSGVLLFALSKDAAGRLKREWDDGKVSKSYLAVVRGYIEEHGCIDTPLRASKDDPYREACTRYTRLATVELPVPVPPHPTTRYSLIEAEPLTGRMHQIRKHLKHAGHPIIGDTQHGRSEHNHLFRDRFGIERLLLHASRLSFTHPLSGETVDIHAPLPDEVRALFDALGWSDTSGAPARTVRAHRPMAARIDVCAEEPGYWDLGAGPELLLGGAAASNLFQTQDPQRDLDALAACGGNYLRCAMTSCSPGSAWAFEQDPDTELYDLTRSNEAYWRRFDRFLELSEARNIVVQVELWDRYEFTRDAWARNPFNPKNNINYDTAGSGLPEQIDSHPDRQENAFFRSVPEQDANTLVLDAQHRHIDRLLELALARNNVLYGIDNATHGDPGWSRYWAEYVNASAARAERRVHTTDVWGTWDITEPIHENAGRPSEARGFVEISPNTHMRDEEHWDRLVAYRAMMTSAGDRRPMNAAQTYGSNNGVYGRDRDAVERFWRNILAGVAAVCFHRPPSGLGLSALAETQIRSMRSVLERFDVAGSSPEHATLTDASRGEAYASGHDGGPWVIFFSDGGDVTLTNAGDSDLWQIHWMDVMAEQWQAPEARRADADGLHLITPVRSGYWVCVVQAAS